MMKGVSISVVSLAVAGLGMFAEARAREVTDFNAGWRFARFGAMPDGGIRPEPGRQIAFSAARASSEGKHHPAAHAVDGNRGTRWCADGDSKNQWLELDLGRHVDVASVQVVWEQNAAYPCRLEGSEDGVDWRLLAEDKTPEASLVTDLAQLNQNLRKLRLTVTGTSPSRWASVRELTCLDVHGKAIKPRAPVPKNRGDMTPAEAVGFDDSGWRGLNLPHDWAIEGPFRMELPNCTGKLPFEGIGWYRKDFSVPASDRGKKVFIDFDGAMSRSKVYINGHYAGGWPYGYSSFRIELTDHINFGAENTVAVRLDNKGESSRWYPGGGIYRNVRLVKTAPVHVAHWGVSITTPVVKKNRATVKVVTELVGATASTKLMHAVYEAGSNEIVARGEGANCSISVISPKPWNLETPNLYVLKTVVLQNGSKVDAVENTFGIRTIEYTADRGFLLNGKRVQMNGVCMHHDLGPLGTAVNTRALERQIEILQSMGCNAIRTSHNPPAPELLDLCDRMGMVVMVEAFDCWKKGKTKNDYSNFFPEWHGKDLTAMIKRDRNHPSVVMWSTGNEVREQWDQGDNHNISQMLTDIVHRLDPTRPVSVGCNNGNAGWNGFQNTVDLFGYNYKPHLYPQFHEKNPDQPLYGSETASTLSSRGEYFFPLPKKKTQGTGGYFQVSSYDLTAAPWATIPDVEFEAQDRFPYVFGEFVWTGFDYIGEPTPYNKDKTNLLNFSDPDERRRMQEKLEKLGGNIPPRSSYFGILDLCGFKKDRFYLYQAHWRPDLPMAHILPHWNWPERVGKVTPVHVYTSGDEAELFLNGKSLGRKKKGQYEYRLRWDDVVYQPGELKVVAYRKGKKWAEDTMKTTGKAAKVDLSADRSVIQADGRDLSFITVQVSDKDGLLVPRSHNEVEFKVEGSGRIVAVGNGNPASHEPFQASKRKAFNGLCLVVVQSIEGNPGTIRLTATSTGLDACTIDFETKKGANK